MIQIIGAVASVVGGFLLNRVNTPTAATTSAAALAPLMIAQNPKMLEALGAGLPVVESLESSVGQAVLLLLSIVLFLVRGGCKKGAAQ